MRQRAVLVYVERLVELGQRLGEVALRGSPVAAA